MMRLSIPFPPVAQNFETRITGRTGQRAGSELRDVDGV